MRLATLVLLGGLWPAGEALAEIVGDPEAGQRISGQCRTCHGADGYAQIPIAPHIGGEPQAYLRSQLTAFRDGTREHEMMSIVARGLSDQQIADLSAWYGAQRVRVEMAADPSGAPEACVACHGADGLHTAEDVPNLAGETNIYIDTQLKAFRSGKRTHEIMSSIAADLSDTEIRAYADWYAAIKLYISAPE
jgi:cytochrome c553